MKVTVAAMAAEVPMGAQVYEHEIMSRAKASLKAVRPDATAAMMTVRSLRSPLPGDRRVPRKWLGQASVRERRMAGRMLYGGSTVVHRMGLELPPSPKGNVVTLHDVVAWRFPDESAPVRSAKAELQAADAVICVSQFSASEAEELLGLRNTVVVHNGVDPQFFNAAPASEETLRAVGVPGRYVLVAGGASERKNLSAVADAWRLVESKFPDVSLLLIGPPHPRRTELFRDLPRTVLAGRVDSELVPSLFAAAAAVVVPSKYEGFGLPALEAMAVGTPLVAARTSSLPEVVQDGGLLVEPTGQGLAAGMECVLLGGQDVAASVVRGREIARDFTWERSAERHAEVWASLL